MDSSQSYALMDSDCIPQREVEFDGEWYEDPLVDGEWPEVSRENFSTTGNSNSTVNILEELYQRNTFLDKLWRETDQKLKVQAAENQKLNALLNGEREKVAKLQKFIQLLQGSTSSLRGDVKPIEMTESSSQTATSQLFNIFKHNYAEDTPVEVSEGSELKDSTETAGEGVEQKCQVDIQSGDDIIQIKRADIFAVKETIQQLRDMIQRREETWDLCRERESQYTITIDDLQRTIQVMGSRLMDKDSKIDRMKNDLNVLGMYIQENEFLKKLIVKLEKRYREMGKLYKTEKQISHLNEQEKDIIHQIIKRYHPRSRYKSARSRSTSSRKEHSPTPPRSPRVEGDVPHRTRRHSARRAKERQQTNPGRDVENDVDDVLGHLEDHRERAD